MMVESFLLLKGSYHLVFMYLFMILVFIVTMSMFLTLLINF